MLVVNQLHCIMIIVIKIQLVILKQDFFVVYLVHIHHVIVLFHQNSIHVIAIKDKHGLQQQVLMQHQHVSIKVHILEIVQVVVNVLKH
jgi:hypothetical protein